MPQTKSELFWMAYCAVLSSNYPAYASEYAEKAVKEFVTRWPHIFERMED